MNNSHPVVDTDALARVERLYRDLLSAQPCDNLARLRLAWCLLLQALHQAGRESAVNELLHLSPGDSLDASYAAPPGRDAQTLLRECLRQTITVRHLSPAQTETSEAEHLQSLASLSGSGQSLLEAEQEALEALQRLARDISHWDDEELGKQA